MIGIILAVVYANFIEYAWHRWFMHAPTGAVADRHREHHRRPDEDLALIFTPAVMAMYVIHAVIFLFARWYAPLAAITIYLLIVEALHRLQHRYNYGYHLAHHRWPPRRFNVFLPIFDVLLGTF